MLRSPYSSHLAQNIETHTMTNRLRGRKAEHPLPSQTLSRAGAANHFQSLRSQVFRDKHHGPQQSGGNNNNGNNNANINSLIKCLAWNGSGTRVACGHGDRCIRVWIPDHVDGRGMTEMKNSHERGVESIDWDPLHADRLASCSSDGGVKIWDTRAKQLLAETRTGYENVIVRYSCDGQFLAVATAKTDLILIYYVKRGASTKSKGNNGPNGWKLKSLCTFKENEEIFDLQWAENGSSSTYALASGLGNGNVRIYQFSPSENLEKQCEEELLNSENNIDTEMKNANDSEAPDSNGTDNEKVSESTDNINTIQNVFTLRGHRTAANCLMFDPKGCYLAVGSNEGIVSLWDLQDFICIKTFNKTE